MCVCPIAGLTNYHKFSSLRASQVALMVKNLPANAGDRFDPWVRKIPWGRAWQPTLVFLPGESHGQRSLEATPIHYLTVVESEVQNGLYRATTKVWAWLCSFLEAWRKNLFPPFSASRSYLHSLTCDPILHLQSQQHSTFKFLSLSPLFPLSHLFWLWHFF